MSFLLERLGVEGSRLVQPVVSHLWTSIFLLFVVIVAALLGRQLTAASRFPLVLIGLLKFAVPAIGGTVSVHWQNVPWDQALDSILEENGLTYRIKESKIHISKK